MISLAAGPAAGRIHSVRHAIRSLRLVPSDRNFLGEFPRAATTAPLPRGGTARRRVGFRASHDLDDLRMARRGGCGARRKGGRPTIFAAVGRRSQRGRRHRRSYRLRRCRPIGHFCPLYLRPRLWLLLFFRRIARCHCNHLHVIVVAFALVVLPSPTVARARGSPRRLGQTLLPRLSLRPQKHFRNIPESVVLLLAKREQRALELVGLTFDQRPQGSSILGEFALGEILEASTGDVPEVGPGEYGPVPGVGLPFQREQAHQLGAVGIGGDGQEGSADQRRVKQRGAGEELGPVGPPVGAVPPSPLFLLVAVVVGILADPHNILQGGIPQLFVRVVLSLALFRLNDLARDSRFVHLFCLLGLLPLSDDPHHGRIDVLLHRYGGILGQGTHHGSLQGRHGHPRTNRRGSSDAASAIALPLHVPQSPQNFAHV
mmetsp:Transcript_154/g.336  ORF Transcript_154/g.336 Transcript_154/m.336 type:complete len:430 (+) Transcript_154:562-1851(+)